MERSWKYRLVCIDGKPFVNFISSVRLKLWGEYIFTTGKLFILHKVNLRARKSIDYGHLCNSWPRWFSQIILANVVFIQPVLKNSHLNHQYCGLSSNPQRVAALSVCIFAYFNRFGFFSIEKFGSQCILLIKIKFRRLFSHCHAILTQSSIFHHQLELLWQLL